MRTGVKHLAQAMAMAFFTAGVLAITYGRSCGQVKAEVSEVVVTAHKKDVSTILRQVRSISEVHSGQITRFEDPICTEVAGLPKPMEVELKKLIKDDVSKAGATSAREGCAPNLTIVVTEDGRAFLKGLIRINPGLFDDFYIAQREQFIRKGGPVWSWKSSLPKRRDGGSVDHIASISFGPNDPPRPLAKGAYIVSNVEHGRLISPVRIDTAVAIVVIDAAAIDGLNLRQIAAYCTYVGISPVDVEREGDASSSDIVSLFADKKAGIAPPEDLSRFDLAYLRALYSGEGGYTFEQKTRAMAIAIEAANDARVH